MTKPFQDLIEFIKSLYPGLYPVPLHAPIFTGNEKKYMQNCIDTTFVSSVGKYVTQFEEITTQYTGAKHAVAFVNGTAALHIALQVAGVERGDEVITQSLTFVATANAIAHAGAEPVFVDVDMDTLGMSPVALSKWLKSNVFMDAETKSAVNITTNRTISGIVPMHTFGNPCRIDEIVAVANQYNIPVIEDSAESLGSTYRQQHTGTFGLVGVFSYNGNKTITTGGGGMIITNNEELAAKARHLSTTAKISHRWEFSHDEIGYNYRLNNVSASIGVAQMEKLEEYLVSKRQTSEAYSTFCKSHSIEFFQGLAEGQANNWLNAIIMKNRSERDAFLIATNDNGVMTRPLWKLMHKLDIYMHCQHDGLENSLFLEDRIVNVPSGVRRLNS
ncbi:MAG: LegC family aminotransferase [Bacteroidetes bacterium]|jgi:perosamine synthetase|nr:LegC family aminotransferase [Bacteroidota bacterium]